MNARYRHAATIAASLVAFFGMLYSLDALSIELTQWIGSIVAEMFGWAPETFA